MNTFLQNHKKLSLLSGLAVFSFMIIMPTLAQACYYGDYCVACYNDSECGVSGPTGSLFCQGNSVYQNYKVYTCQNPGTEYSYCATSTVAQLQETCSGNQTCTGGCCKIVCTNNSYKGCVGSSLYWYDSCGNKQGIYKYCINGCANGDCLNNNCTNNAYKQCDGNSLYWYDSCGKKQGIAQYCVNGCANNECLGSSCTNNSYKSCVGSSLYWFDSCGKQQGIAQYCPNGCSGGICLNNNCTNNAYQKCENGNIYWFDSCGNRQGLVRSCV